MTGYQRVCALVALMGGAFSLLVAALPTWTVTAPDGSDERVAWWDPVLLQHANPFPLLAFVLCLAGLVLVAVTLLRRRAGWVPLGCYILALACSVIGVLVHGRWFLVGSGIGVQGTTIAMTLLMAYTPPAEQARRRAGPGR